MDPWDILGISETADHKVIKRAYAARIKHCHPEDDPQKFQVLREAYEAALAWYDYDGADFFAENKAHPATSETPGLSLEEAKTFTFKASSSEETTALEISQEVFEKFLNTFLEKDIQPALEYLQTEIDGSRLWKNRLTLDLVNLHLLQFFEQYDFWPSDIIGYLTKALHWNFRLDQLEKFIGPVGLDYFRRKIEGAQSLPHLAFLEKHWQYFVIDLETMTLEKASHLLNEQLKLQLKQTPELEIYLYPFFIEKMTDETLDPEILIEIWFGYNLGEYIDGRPSDDPKASLYNLALGQALAVIHDLEAEKTPYYATRFSQKLFNFVFFFVLMFGVILLLTGFSFLLEKATNKPSLTPLERQFISNQSFTTTQPLEALQLLLEKGTTSQLKTFLKQVEPRYSFAKESNLERPLYLSLKSHQFGKAEVLIDYGADPNGMMPTSGHTHLIEAILGNNEKGVSFLLEQGADPNGVGRVGFPPLYLAIQLDHNQIAKALLDRGADPHWTSEQMKLSPRELAKTKENLRVLKWMDQIDSQTPKP